MLHRQVTVPLSHSAHFYAQLGGMLDGDMQVSGLGGWGACSWHYQTFC